MQSNSSLGADPKGDAGSKKTPLQLIPPPSAAALAWSLRHGADKYGEWNWRKTTVKASTYIGAIKRHLDAFVSGEIIDREADSPNVTHLGAVMASAAILIDAMNNGTLEDDRPPGKPPAGAASLSVPDAEEPKNILSFTGGVAPGATDRPHPLMDCQHCGQLRLLDHVCPEPLPQQCGRSETGYCQHGCQGLCRDL